MKILKTIFFLLTILLFTISCSKDDNDPAADPITYATENPLDLFLANSGFGQKTTSAKNSGFYEYGFSFKPTVTGKITALVVKIPDVNAALKVTLWNATTKTVIRTETLNVPDADVAVEKTIESIALTKDKEYYITVNSDDWYSRNKTDGTATTYPVAAGNITVTGFAYMGTTEGVIIFPVNSSVGFYSGDTSFKFQRTE